MPKYSTNIGTIEKPKYSFDKLYYNLLKKYDNAIIHIEERKGKNIVKPPNKKDEF